MHEYRVTCPDGAEVDRFQSDDPDRALSYAMEEAARCDRLHDGARCQGLHRVELNIGWREIAR